MDLSSHKIDVRGESKDVLCSEQELLAWMDCIYQEYTCIKEESNAWFISIAFISKEEMQDLNKSFTGEDRPTNVLSFPNDLNIRNEMGLGDIAICSELIKEESDSQNKQIKDHLIHIFIHGVLHLLGYNHEKDSSATEMESLEVKILKKIGVADPY